jgi:hypothetical protein
VHLHFAKTTLPNNFFFLFLILFSKIKSYLINRKICPIIFALKNIIKLCILYSALVFVGNSIYPAYNPDDMLKFCIAITPQDKFEIYLSSRGSLVVVFTFWLYKSKNCHVVAPQRVTSSTMELSPKTTSTQPCSNVVR